MMEVEKLEQGMEQQIKNQREIIQQQLQEIAELHKKNAGMFQKIGQMETDFQVAIVACEAEKEQLGKNLEKSYSRIQELLGIQKRLEKEAECVRQCLDENLADMSALENRINMLENSKSWKITAPLRWMMWKIGRK